MKKGYLSILFLMFVSMVVMGCTSTDEIITPKDPRSMNYPLEIKDQTGHLMTIEKEPQRIVSLAPSATEIAFALELQKEIVAVTNNDDYPEAVKKLPKVGDIKINVEQVLAQKPDLVLASTANDKNTIDQLRRLKIPVIVTDGKEIKQIYQAIDIVAQATNRTYEAEQLIAKMNKEIRQWYGKIVQIPENERLKVWIEVGPDLYTVGGDDFLNEILTMAGGVNVAGSEKGWPKISSEQVVKWQPDVIISIYGGKKEILSRKGWETIPAIQQKRVYDINPDLLSRPGPRVPQAIEAMIKVLYPDRIGDQQK